MQVTWKNLLKAGKPPNPGSARVTRNVPFYTKCAVLVLTAHYFVQLQFTAMRCYAPDPAAGRG